jgi:hypothetical protein
MLSVKLGGRTVQDGEVLEWVIYEVDSGIGVRCGSIGHKTRGAKGSKATVRV